MAFVVESVGVCRGNADDDPTRFDLRDDVCAVGETGAARGERRGEVEAERAAAGTAGRPRFFGCDAPTSVADSSESDELDEEDELELCARRDADAAADAAAALRLVGELDVSMRSG